MRDVYSNPYAIGSFVVSEEILRVVMVVLAAVMTVAMVTRLVLFALRSVGLYKIARRRGLRSAWLAWVPVACDWVMGSVADQYQYVVKGRIKNRRLPLVLLKLSMTILRIITVSIGFTWLQIGIQTLMGQIPVGAVTPLLGAYVMPVLAWACGVAYLVIRCFAVYDLYRSCTEKYNVLYLVLGLVFKFLEPVFFLLCRNKEEGMPPRRQQTVTPEPEPENEEM